LLLLLLPLLLLLLPLLLLLLLQFLEECRVSLLAGLKRHFRFKAAEGCVAISNV
jgi:hypothetical protein